MYIPGMQGKGQVVFFFNWSIMALQRCVSFCYTPKGINYIYTHMSAPS